MSDLLYSARTIDNRTFEVIPLLEGMTLVVVPHKRSFAKVAPRRAVIMNDENIIEEGASRR